MLAKVVNMNRYKVRLLIYDRRLIVQYIVAADNVSEAVDKARQLALERFEFEIIRLISCPIIEED